MSLVWSKCKAPIEIEKGEIVGGFAHAQVFALADKVVDAVKGEHDYPVFIGGGPGDEQFTVISVDATSELIAQVDPDNPVIYILQSKIFVSWAPFRNPIVSIMAR